ncbi:hypothetical protein BDQ17DRAFT_1342003 [Cyathus striatus]|nr:hypothetical protein BDQ17DRAFT_1383713 [Cyathus striatus]KAF9014065.1 hypothetical protein BDQ17DRAFT_1342003 [Cyathus striatus]
MASFLVYRAQLNSHLTSAVARTTLSRRTLATSTSTASSSTTADVSNTTSEAPKTHFKITLRRSAIALGKKKQETVVSLGIHRRFQTVYHRHTSDIAGKILSIKELLDVENVAEHEVKTKQQMREQRKAVRGYNVVRSRIGAELGI